MTAAELAEMRDRIARARLERESERAGGPAHPARVWGAIRYDTVEERVAARRKTWRESKKRLYGSCPKCGGEKAATPSVAMCRSCWSRVRKGEIPRG